jgi:hypothetical protein
VDSTTAIAVVAIFGVIVIAVVLVFRHRIRVGIRGPGQMGLDVEAANEPSRPTGGARVEKVEAGGHVVTKVTTGDGAVVKKVKADGDVRTTVSEGDRATKKA